MVANGRKGGAPAQRAAKADRSRTIGARAGGGGGGGAGQRAEKEGESQEAAAKGRAAGSGEFSKGREDLPRRSRTGIFKGPAREDRGRSSFGDCVGDWGPDQVVSAAFCSFGRWSPLESPYFFFRFVPSPSRGLSRGLGDLHSSVPSVRKGIRKKKEKKEGNASLGNDRFKKKDRKSVV